ncbi:MAG: hypothetical protein H7Z37_05250 [Pyrinomonadaceae bacterium]|nr:hypothetical protein [Pyrinomonadaceae bacterium]
MPVQTDLDKLAPEKTLHQIESTISIIKKGILEAKDLTNRKGEQPKYTPAGQSTQIVVGATATADGAILHKAEKLYRGFNMRRVYYSAFSPIPDSSALLPTIKTPLMREHRLYEADWLIRNYGFTASEITHGASEMNLDLDKDPKLAWALRHRDYFPLDINKASARQLLRVPGLGARNVSRILKIRHFHNLRIEDLAKLRVRLDKAKWFITTSDYNPNVFHLDAEQLFERIKPKAVQLSLFDNIENTALTGEI